MSNMLVSLLLKVREEGADAIGKVRDTLRGLDRERIGEAIGQSMVWGFRQGRTEVHALGHALREARTHGKELYETLVHGTIGLAAATFAFKKSFLDVAVEAEQARIRLQAIEESPGRAEAAMAWTEKFREKTAFALEDVRQAWIELRTHGVRPTESAMTAIADVATAMGMKMAEAARIVGDTVEGGRYHRLREFGIQAKEVGNQLVLQYRYLGRVITETVPKADKLQVAQKLIEILSKTRGGAAEAASKGLTGTLMSMQEGWKQFALQVMEEGGVFDALKAKVREFAEAGKEAGEGDADAAQTAAAFLKQLVNGLGDLAIWAKTRLPEIRREFMALIEPIGGLKTVAIAVAAVLAAPFVASLIAIAGPIVGLVVTGITLLVGALTTLAAFVVGTLIPAVYALGVALLTTPIGWIILGITALVAAAWLLYQNWNEVTAALGRVWKWVETVASEVWKGITDTAAEAVSNVQQKWEAVRGFFRSLFDDIKSWWDATFGAIGRGIDWLKDHIPSFSTPTPSSSASDAVGGSRADGRLKIDIQVDSEGRPSGRIRESDAGGGPQLDPSLGFAMAF